jgi:ribosomal protein S18 acetylase RimI-like enzyme
MRTTAQFLLNFQIGGILVVGAQVSQSSAFSMDGLRPVNLRTDLGPLADLIEVAFARNMDNAGRALVREIRQMSLFGAGLGLLAGGLVPEMNLGYVWVADGKLVGNVSVYPASGTGFDGQTYVIVNVAVHPDYQRRGIAHQLMQAALEAIARREGRSAILQVDADNAVARRLYLRLGFIEERAWTTWRRGGSYTMPPPLDNRGYITHRRPNEWQAEYALAAHIRPALMGGLGWLKPLHPDYFRPRWWQAMSQWFTFRRTERLIIRSANSKAILASLWIATGLGSTTRLTLMVHPDYEGHYDEALLNTAVRRFGSEALSIEHPTDRAATNAILRRYQFHPRLDVVHMRWDAR